MNRKGIAGLWLWVLVSVFLVGAVYIMMSRPMKLINDRFTDDLTGDEAITAAKIMKAWNAWPLLFILLGAIVMVIGSIKGSSPPQSEGYF